MAKKEWVKIATGSKTLKRARKKYMWGEGVAEPWQFDPPMLKVDIRSGLRVWYRPLWRGDV